MAECQPQVAIIISGLEPLEELPWQLGAAPVALDGKWEDQNLHPAGLQAGLSG